MRGSAEEYAVGDEVEGLEIAQGFHEEVARAELRAKHLAEPGVLLATDERRREHDQIRLYLHLLAAVGVPDDDAGIPVDDRLLLPCVSDEPHLVVSFQLPSQPFPVLVRKGHVPV